MFTTTGEQRLARRVAELSASDPQFAAVRPIEAATAAIQQLGARLAEIVDRVGRPHRRTGQRVDPRRGICWRAGRDVALDTAWRTWRSGSGCRRALQRVWSPAWKPGACCGGVEAPRTDVAFVQNARQRVAGCCGALPAWPMPL